MLPCTATTRRCAPSRRDDMRSQLIAVVLALAALLAARPTHAANDFTIDWYESNHADSCLGLGLLTEGDTLFYVNTIPIRTFSDWGTYREYAGNAFEMWFHAPFSGALFRVGMNQ